VVPRGLPHSLVADVAPWPVLARVILIYEYFLPVVGRRSLLEASLRTKVTLRVVEWSNLDTHVCPKRGKDQRTEVYVYSETSEPPPSGKNERLMSELEQDWGRCPDLGLSIQRRHCSERSHWSSSREHAEELACKRTMAEESP